MQQGARMGGAWIDGRPVARESAIAEAARMLGASRFAVIAGLGADIRGARAAIALAERVGGAIDHMHSSAIMRDVDVLRESGLMITTPSEAGLRGDVLLLVGPGLEVTWPELPQRVLARGPGREVAEGFSRRVIRLCPGRSSADHAAGAATVRTVGRAPSDLAALLAALRARIAGRPVGRAPVSAKVLDELAADLKSARFGVAVWSAGELGALTIEMLCGVVKDLNAKTRFSGLPLAAGDNAAGVLQACGWMTGFPMRTGFARGYPEHDPWRFDAARIMEAGEADCAVWISAYRAVAPRWPGKVPMIALCAEETKFEDVPRVQIAVGRPGIDHDSVELLAATGGLAAVAAANPTGAISVADAIGGIAAALPHGRVWPC
jgi:formylmethanofuran dehydrogenase subunit B